MLNFAALLLDPIYTVQGVPVVLTLADTRSFDTFTMLDKTGGINTGENIEVPTIQPGACVRATELAAAGLAPEELIDATLVMNGFSWTVMNYKIRPTPGGESAGEYLLVLAGKEVASEETSST